jgi:hypothetical protein
MLLSSTINSQQTTHHNTSLTATNINLNTTQNTKIKGLVSLFWGNV